MAYFWVNHKQTCKQERTGNYLWSPYRKSDGTSNPTYDSMARALPGDIVFSYANAQIGAIGQVSEKARGAAKPAEFGTTGDNWSDQGWLLPVTFNLLPTPLAPKKWIDKIAPLLPDKYSPIRANGNGNQGCYLAPISDELGALLLTLVGNQWVPAEPDQAEQLEEDVREIEAEPTLSDTEKDQLVRARRGQGKFRDAVLAREPRCRVTGVGLPALLKASHIKPWRASTNAERLDGNNGLMLAPHIDTLFDRGWISFADDGQMLLSQRLPKSVLEQWSIDPSANVGRFSASQAHYLADHRQRFGFP